MSPDLIEIVAIVVYGLHDCIHSDFHGFGMLDREFHRYTGRQGRSALPQIHVRSVEDRQTHFDFSDETLAVEPDKDDQIEKVAASNGVPCSPQFTNLTPIVTGFRR